MKLFSLLSITTIIFLSYSHQLFAHGAIEKIDCKSKESKIKLFGVSNSETKGGQNKLDFVLEEGGKKKISSDKTSLSLKDIAKGSMVIEEIKFSLSPKVHAKLSIPEDYSKEVRPGEGTLSFDQKGRVEKLDCVVTY